METVLADVSIGKQLTGYENVFVGVNFPSITLSGASLDSLTQDTPLNDFLNQPLPPPTSPPTGSSTSSSNKEEDNSWWMWIIVALIILIGGTAAAIFLKKNSSK
jgi:hypothetical protein